LECAKYWNVTWQHIQVNIGAQLDTIMDSIYYSLNRKLDALQKQEHYNYNSKTITKHTSHTRLVNLMDIKFNKELVNTLNLGFEYAIKKTQNSTLMH
jgi:hypothetical protein